MKKTKLIELGFIVDKLTNSIQNTISGDSFPTKVVNIQKEDLKYVTTSKGWVFDWKVEFANKLRNVYKLTIVNNPQIIQGLLSVSIEEDHVYMHLLENAPFNIGKNKLYDGVAGNLVAQACKISFEHGFGGFIAFTAKSKLIDHYKKALGAHRLGSNRMIIPTDSASKLVNLYFKD